eukprot:1821032-Prymnesium_polylepis.2
MAHMWSTLVSPDVKPSPLAAIIPKLARPQRAPHWSPERVLAKNVKILQRANDRLVDDHIDQPLGDDVQRAELVVLGEDQVTRDVDRRLHARDDHHQLRGLAAAEEADLRTVRAP